MNSRKALEDAIESSLRLAMQGFSDLDTPDLSSYKYDYATRLIVEAACVVPVLEKALNSLNIFKPVPSPLETLLDQADHIDQRTLNMIRDDLNAALANQRRRHQARALLSAAHSFLVNLVNLPLHNDPTLGPVIELGTLAAGTVFLGHDPETSRLYVCVECNTCGEVFTTAPLQRPEDLSRQLVEFDALDAHCRPAPFPVGAPPCGRPRSADDCVCSPPLVYVPLEADDDDVPF